MYHFFRQFLTGKDLHNQFRHEGVLLVLQQFESNSNGTPRLTLVESLKSPRRLV